MNEARRDVPETDESVRHQAHRVLDPEQRERLHERPLLQVDSGRILYPIRETWRHPS